MRDFRTRFNPAVQVISLVIIGCLLLGAGGFAGYQFGRYGQLRPPANVKNATSGEVSVNFGIFWQAWNAINANFYPKADAQKQLDGAIAGMVSGLGDPFTDYFPPSQNKLFQSQLAGSFDGIGAELDTTNGNLIVVAPLSGSPAEQAGLKAQDIITKIDGKAVAGINFDDAVNMIRGTKGSIVTLTIVRQGTDAPFDVKVTRNTITVPTVSTQTLGSGKDISYIKVSQFGADTTTAFNKAVTGAKDSNAKGVIIDLRDNPGGYLQGAADDIGMLLPAAIDSDKSMLKSRIAVVEKFRDGSSQNDPAGTDSILPQTPIVILVNGGSASASEIFTGAMRDYNRAKIVGTKTFGKGSAQNVIPLTNGGSVKVTIAHWFTPLGIGINGTGLQPDYKVDLPANTIPSTSDVQVQKALELLGE